MKKSLLLLLLLLSSAVGFSQKFYVTVGSLGYPDAKLKAVLASRTDILRDPVLSVKPSIGTVVSFTMSYLPNKGEYVGPKGTIGMEMTDEEKSWIEHCGSGDKFYFEEIKVKLNDGSSAVVNAPAFLVKVQ